MESGFELLESKLFTMLSLVNSVNTGHSHIPQLTIMQNKNNIKMKDEELNLGKKIS
jgi:hypothetical protein